MNGKQNLDQHQSPLNPGEHGWETNGNENIKIKWTTKSQETIQYSKILQIRVFFFFLWLLRAKKELANILKTIF